MPLGGMHVYETVLQKCHLFYTKRMFSMTPRTQVIMKGHVRDRLEKITGCRLPPPTYPHWRLKNIDSPSLTINIYLRGPTSPSMVQGI